MSTKRKIKDGGGAFPIWLKDEGYGPVEQPGMTLRDYFAAAALSGRMANPNWCESERDDAELAYSVADDMLKERAK